MRRLKDKEVKALLKEFIQLYPSAVMLESAKIFDELAVGEGAVYFLDNVPLLLRTKVGLLPSLKFEKLLTSLPRIIVDMGAVAHLVNGADLMRPGVKEVQGEFGEHQVVAVVDEKYGKPITIGYTDVNAQQMRQMTKGKVARNVHYVGDEFWKTFKPS
jgi:PUA domain protein